MSSRSDELDVIYEDNHLLAVNKPAMLPTMGVGASRPSLIATAKRYLAKKYNKPGNVYLGVVSRLDAPVTGVVLMARTSKAASRLSAAFRNREVKKTYWAGVEGELAAPRAVLVNYLRKDERHRRVHATHADCPGAQLAKLKYLDLGAEGDVSLVEVEPETGRKHQIRVQLAKLGNAILGDRKYGARAPFNPGIALHSLRLEFDHPVRRQWQRVEAPLPAQWRRHAALSKLIGNSSRP